MDLSQLLAASAATEAFKTELRAYAEGHAVSRIQVARRAPSIKVLRVLCQLLWAEPDLPVEDVFIQGRSGCSDFIGRLSVRTTTGIHQFEFAWDCGWRAEQEAWRDAYGFPDQIRAAQEYGWRCFRIWRRSDDSDDRLSEAMAS